MNEQRNPKGGAKPQATIQTVEPELGGVEKMADAPFGLDFEPETVWLFLKRTHDRHWWGGKKPSKLYVLTCRDEDLIWALLDRESALQWLQRVNLKYGATTDGEPLEGFEPVEMAFQSAIEFARDFGSRGLVAVDRLSRVISRRYVR